MTAPPTIAGVFVEVEGQAVPECTLPLRSSFWGTS